MVHIDTKDPKWIVKFKKKEQRTNRIDDKFEIFRQIVGLGDVRDILDLNRYTGGHMSDPIRKTKETVTDINNYDNPFITARLDQDQVNRLRKNPNIEYVQEDGRVFASAQTTDWGVAQIKSPEAWVVSSKRGQGIEVAVLDSGAPLAHPDLAGQISINQSFLDSDSSAEDKFSGVWHGSHVIGTIVMLDNSEGFVGVAPGAKAWNLRFLDQNGSGSFIDWVEALEFARNNNAPIVNQSIQTAEGTRNQALEDSMKSGYDGKGIIYTCALGNFAVAESNNNPSNAYGAWGVSNVQQSDLNLFGGPNGSNHGTFTDFGLPGSPIQSCKAPTGYISHNGTSMASPHLAGICALGLAEWNPGGGGSIYNTGNKAKNTVMFAALKLSVNKNGKFTSEWDNRFGFGMPEANKVVSILKSGCV